MASPHYELGTLVGGIWTQWTTPAGQDYYENLTSGATQYDIPAGWEDVAADIWAADASRPWPQWRNFRTGRFIRQDPNPPAPRTYLDKPNIQTHLRFVERSPESHEYLYRRVVVTLLRYFFPEDEGFEVFQEESRGEVRNVESIADMTVLKIISRPGGSMYSYDYCLVESKSAGRNWNEAEDHLARHCEGVLTALTGVLHIRDDVAAITTAFKEMKSNPLPFL